MPCSYHSVRLTVVLAEVQLMSGPGQVGEGRWNNWVVGGGGVPGQFKNVTFSMSKLTALLVQITV